MPLVIDFNFNPFWLKTDYYSNVNLIETNCTNHTLLNALQFIYLIGLWRWGACDNATKDSFKIISLITFGLTQSMHAENDKNDRFGFHEIHCYRNANKKPLRFRKWSLIMINFLTGADKWKQKQKKMKTCYFLASYFDNENDFSRFFFTQSNGWMIAQVYDSLQHRKNKWFPSPNWSQLSRKMNDVQWIFSCNQLSNYFH